jgi:hypothetical protein
VEDRADDSDMETRKVTREQAWSVGSWSDTVQQVSRHVHTPWCFPSRVELTPDCQARAIHEDGDSGAMQVEPAAVRGFHQPSAKAAGRREKT